MPKLIVNGGKRLEGCLKIQGSKNTVLPVIMSALLTDEKIILHDYPDILDVKYIIKTLESIGCRCFINEKTIEITSKDKITYIPNPELCKKTRASVNFMGALIGRLGKFIIPYPGGCSIGRRPVNFHMDGLKKMGVLIEEKEGMLYGKCDMLHGCEYTFPYPSVGALENLIMAAVKAKGESVFYNCATEPEITDLCDMLRKMGAKIRGDGTEIIKISGKESLHGCEYHIPGDRIVAGTYMAACAVAGGNIKIENIGYDRVKSVVQLIRSMGCHVIVHENGVTVLADGRLRSVPYIKFGPYPELPTDMQPLVCSMVSYADGTCLLTDNVFENRYGTAYELKKMGACIEVMNDGVIIHGREFLVGNNVNSKDLRGGAALVIAALGAANTTVIHGYSHIQRGYENIQRDLKKLGADIRWEDDET